MAVSAYVKSLNKKHREEREANRDPNMPTRKAVRTVPSQPSSTSKTVPTASTVAVTPPMPTATATKSRVTKSAPSNTVPPMPSTGVGGTNYSNASGGQRKQLEGQRQKELNNPEYNQSEVERTLGVIKERESQGLDVSAQNKYLTSNLGYTPPKPKEDVSVASSTTPPTNSVPPPPPTTFTPPNPNDSAKIPQQEQTIPAMDQEAISKYVSEQLQSKLAQLRSSADSTIQKGQTTANQQLQGLQTNYDRSEALESDNRKLQDTKFDRLNNPFSGGTDYRKGLMERERGITDRYQDQDLSSRQANVQQDLADLENEINQKYAAAEQAAPAERERMMREIKKDERNYGLMLRGELRSDMLANSQLQNTDFQQSLQSFNTNRGVYESDRNFGYRQERDQVGDERYDEQFGYQKQRDQVGDQRYDEQFDYQQGRDQVSDQKFDQQFDYKMYRDAIGDERYQAEFDQNVQQWGAEFALGKALKEGQLDVSRMNANTSRQNANTSQKNAARAENQANLDNLYRQWETTGRAPDGIPGVQAGEELPQGSEDHPTFSNLLSIWRNSGKAPQGIPGIEPGTPYYDPVQERYENQQGNALDYTKVINESRYVNPYSGEVEDPEGLEGYILELDIPNSDKAQLYRLYGLQLPQ